jgi:hypothetical protein
MVLRADELQRPQPPFTRRQLRATYPAYPGVAVANGVVIGVPIDQGLAAFDRLFVYGGFVA